MYDGGEFLSSMNSIEFYCCLPALSFSSHRLSPSKPQLPKGYSQLMQTLSPRTTPLVEPYSWSARESGVSSAEPPTHPAAPWCFGAAAREQKPSPMVPAVATTGKSWKRICPVHCRKWFSIKNLSQKMRVGGCWNLCIAPRPNSIHKSAWFFRLSELVTSSSRLAWMLWALPISVWTPMWHIEGSSLNKLKGQPIPVKQLSAEPLTLMLGKPWQPFPWRTRDHRNCLEPKATQEVAPRTLTHPLPPGHVCRVSAECLNLSTVGVWLSRHHLVNSVLVITILCNHSKSLS